MKYWWRFLIISLITLIVAIIWSLVIWRWYVSDLFTFLEYWQDERQIVWLALLLLLVWSVGLYLLFVWCNLARADQITKIKNPFRSLASKSGQAIKASWSLKGRLISIVIIGLLVTLLYLGTTSLLKPSTVFVLLVLQQATSWLKVGLRISAYQEIVRYKIPT